MHGQNHIKEISSVEKNPKTACFIRQLPQLISVLFYCQHDALLQPIQVLVASQNLIIVIANRQSKHSCQSADAERDKEIWLCAISFRNMMYSLLSCSYTISKDAFRTWTEKSFGEYGNNSAILRTLQGNKNSSLGTA